FDNSPGTSASDPSRACWSRARLFQTAGVETKLNGPALHCALFVFSALTRRNHHSCPRNVKGIDKKTGYASTSGGDALPLDASLRCFCRSTFALFGAAALPQARQRVPPDDTQPGS